MASTSKRPVQSNDDEIANDHEREALLSNDSDQEEDTVFNKPRPSHETPQVHGQLDNIRDQIREVTDVMSDNVRKVLDRGERLEDLQMASERLNVAGSEFRSSARKAHHAAWRRNFIVKFGIAAVVLVILVIILVSVIVNNS